MGTNEKKILIMPALYDHIDLIKEAKKKGYKIVTCDNNPDNEGHMFADIFQNVSLLDIDAVVSMAKTEGITAVTPFSTDIGAIPAAHVAQAMNLVGNPVEAVNIMANKSLFRNFLTTHNFNVPKFQTVSCAEEINFNEINFPSIIKPTDRAGSKGVYVVEDISELKDKLNETLAISFEKKVIVEDYIETEHNQLHGDAIVQDGQLVFCCIGDQYFGKGNMAHSPIATTFPSKVSTDIIKKMKSEIRRFLDLVGYKNGGINIETRVDKNGEIYFIELAPRFGGNSIPKTIGMACNFDIIKCALNIAIGQKVNIPEYKINNNIFQLILRSEREGIFKSVEVIDHKEIEILDCYPVKKTGDYVSLDNGPSNIIAVYIIKASKHTNVKTTINNPRKYFNIKLTNYEHD